MFTTASRPIPHVTQPGGRAAIFLGSFGEAGRQLQAVTGERVTRAPGER
jgi:hypothetical protein